jgi:hypothetical protein
MAGQNTFEILLLNDGCTIFFTEIVGRGIVWYLIIILTTFLQDQDIFVASFPKSGTTWLQQVVYLLFHPDNPDSELMEFKFPYLEHVYPGKKVLFLTCPVGF